MYLFQAICGYLERITVKSVEPEAEKNPPTESVNNNEESPIYNLSKIQLHKINLTWPTKIAVILNISIPTEKPCFICLNGNKILICVNVMK